MTSSNSLLVSITVLLLVILKCHFGFCCSDEHILNDIAGLQHDLEQKLFGQHLAQQLVTAAIRNHLDAGTPEKALVLSFHGFPGVGKSYVSQLIASNLFLNGLKSPYVHFLSATHEFPHKEQLESYKTKLKGIVESSVQGCKRSLFIIDETDKMPVSLLDILTPYVDRKENVEGTDYRETIFIFLSTAGGFGIRDVMLRHLRDGKQRESLTLEEIEDNMVLSSFYADEDGQQSQLVEQQLINAFVAFLPLEKDHVRDCIKADLVAKDYFLSIEDVRDKIVDEVLEALGLDSEKHLFSPTGCKRVSEKVDYVMTKIKLARFKYAEL